VQAAPKLMVSSELTFFGLGFIKKQLMANKSSATNSSSDSKI